MTLTHPGQAALSGAAWLHAPAYSLIGEPLGTTTNALFREALSAGIATSLDASSVGALAAWGPEESRRRFGETGASHLFANEEEVAYLDLIERPIPNMTLIVKRGAGVAEVRDPHGRLVATLPAPPLSEAVDTTELAMRSQAASRLHVQGCSVGRCAARRTPCRERTPDGTAEAGLR